MRARQALPLLLVACLYWTTVRSLLRTVELLVLHLLKLPQTDCVALGSDVDAQMRYRYIGVMRIARAAHAGVTLFSAAAMFPDPLSRLQTSSFVTDLFRCTQSDSLRSIAGAKP